MRTRTDSNAGFSLVELVIVVVIIGVIAAIAVPRISRGAKGAGDAALLGSLAGLRNAIDMFAAEHGGSYPTGADQDALEAVLINKTNAAGTIDADPTKNIYGPYLRSGFPPLSVCANRGKATVKMVTGDPTYQATGEGWVYSTDTGKLIANCDAETDESGTKYNEY